MFDTLRLILAGWRYPEARTLGFLRMGLGIEARRRRFKQSWQEHLFSSRSAQSLWAAQLKSSGKGFSRMLVLGAGRLYDFEDEVAQGLKAVCFLDADPLSLRAWKTFKRENPAIDCSFELAEMTGALERSRSRLRSEIQQLSLEEAVQLLRTIIPTLESTPLNEICRSFKPELILSLNLLSQLPVMWQDIVEQELSLRFGKEVVDAKENDWLIAYAAGGRSLLESHYNNLNASGADEIFLISDVEYFYCPQQFGEQVVWISNAENELSGKWRAVEGGDLPTDWKKLCTRSDSLLGLNIEDETVLAEHFPNYRAEHAAHWLWHISPKSDNGTGEATIHRVRACRLIAKTLSELN